MSKPTKYNTKNDDVWAAAKRQTWEKLRTLREVIAENAKKENAKMAHHDKKKPKKKRPKPKPKKKYGPKRGE